MAFKRRQPLADKAVPPLQGAGLREVRVCMSGSLVPSGARPSLTPRSKTAPEPFQVPVPSVARGGLD